MNHIRETLAEQDYKAISESKVNNILWNYNLDKKKKESVTYIFYVTNYLDKCYYFPLKCFS